MSKMKYLSENKKLRISELYNEGYLSVGAIADKLGVSARTVHNYKDYQQKKGSYQTDSEPKGINNEIERTDEEPKSITDNDDANEELETDNALEFIGGVKEEEKETDSTVKDKYYCGKCGKGFDEIPDRCPSCGVEFEYNTCGSCGTRINGEPEKCPECGAKFYY